jgi:glycosyltransferase involved in cell wall biosynthesis
MLFTDQRWIDLVPGYFSPFILTDPGYNVAYWNLDSRKLTGTDDEWRVDGGPLRFFHFSGYRPETPWLLSKHIPNNARVLLSENDALRALCDAYGEEMKRAGIDSAANQPYRFSKLQDDVTMTMAMRRHYRDAVIAGDREGGEYPPTSPQPDGTNPALLAWFLEPARAGGRVNRILYAAWWSRGDLRIKYPEPLRGDEPAFLKWAAEFAVHDGSAPAGYLSVRDDGAAPPPVIADSTGVNVAGYFQAELGVGQIGRLLVDAVRASDVPFSIWRNSETVNRQLAGFDDTSAAVIYPITIASINADAFPQWAAGLGRPLVVGRYTIGVWAWEIADFPDASIGAFAHVDEIWGISTFCRDAIAAKTDKPVFTLPYQIPIPAEVAPLDRAAFGVVDTPYFFFAFDYQSIFERKNPVGLIEAFNRAFAPGEGPKLIIKTINGDRNVGDRERLLYYCADQPDVILIEEYLPAATVRSLMAEAAAYVSLHRAEGYGLTMSEALALGRPVIATGYSGNLDFMDETNSLLVPYELRPIGAGSAPYPAKAEWAEPNIEVAAQHMRWVIEHPAEANAIGAKARESIRSGGTLDASIDFVRGRVQAIAAQGYKKGPRASPIGRVRNVAGRIKRRAHRELSASPSSTN